MPYQKVITFYSKQERENLHRQGYWVDRKGNVLPVYSMDYERLDKLVKMIAEWAMKEPDPIFYIKNLPIFPAVYSSILRWRMNTYQSSMFKLAAKVHFVQSNNYEYEPTPEEIAQMNLSAEELRLQFEG